MIGDRSVIAFYDERVLEHRPDENEPFLPGKLQRRVQAILRSLNSHWTYPEHPGRVTAIRELLKAEPIKGVTFHKGRRATREQLSRVHTTAYLDDIEALRGQHSWVDKDTTAVSPGSVAAAEVAAGTAVAAIEAVWAGSAQSAFAIIRPPGHHAEPVRARGFCLFNNVAVAAAHAQAKLGSERVLLIDWDAHHANGTQEIFYSDPDVLLFDTHRAAPFYPGTGLLEEVGASSGEGTTVNVPLPAGVGDVAMIKAFQEILVPAADWFRPNIVLVSAGFDTLRLDQAMNMSYAGLAQMTRIVRDIADKHCGGKLCMVLEGGYNLESLARGVHTTLQVMAGGDAPDVCEPGLPEVSEAAEFHRSAFTDE